MQLTNYSLGKALEDMIGASGVFDPANVFVGCYSAVNNLGLNTTMSDVTPCTGSLAPLQEVTDWSPVYQEKSGMDVVDGPIMRFSPTTPADAQEVVGVYLTDSADGGDLLGVIPLPAPVQLLGPQNILSFVVRLTLDPSGTWDASVTWDD